MEQHDSVAITFTMTLHLDVCFRFFLQWIVIQLEAKKKQSQNCVFPRQKHFFCVANSCNQPMPSPGAVIKKELCALGRAAGHWSSRFWGHGHLSTFPPLIHCLFCQLIYTVIHFVHYFIVLHYLNKSVLLIHPGKLNPGYWLLSSLPVTFTLSWTISVHHMPSSYAQWNRNSKTWICVWMALSLTLPSCLWPLQSYAARRLNLLPNPHSALWASLPPLPQTRDTFACCSPCM